MKLSKKKFGNIDVYYRAGVHQPSSDEQAIQEVLARRAYSRVRSHFNVELGERWLDLGANIGAFAAYCRLRGAQAVCFEPEPECFKILQKNAGPQANLFNMCVTASQEPMMTFRKSANPENWYRGTTLSVSGYIDLPPVQNFYADKLKDIFPFGFDGIKMDIEGSEGPILDDWLLPSTSKLVMEYHTSRDASVKNLKRRLGMLRERFINVKYPKAFDTAIAQKLETYRPRFDQLIFAWSPR